MSDTFYYAVMAKGWDARERDWDSDDIIGPGEFRGWAYRGRLLCKDTEFRTKRAAVALARIAYKSNVIARVCVVKECSEAESMIVFERKKRKRDE